MSLKKAGNIALPFLLGGAILWWMYRNTDFTEIEHTVMHDMDWGWMLFSLIFGVTAQLFRGIRWTQMLSPIGERPRMSTCIHAVFISYASSLIIPRSGELARCGVLARYDGTSFLKSLGTVVTERIIDSALILIITAIVILSQMPVFTTFFSQTGVSLSAWLHEFTITGYIVTAICAVAVCIMAWYLLRRLAIYNKVKTTIGGIVQGAMSLRKVKNVPLFVVLTLAIWLSYFLHYYLTFFCFEQTSHLGMACALVTFIVGSIAVIVPTPNGAGPWHFAVKTMLILYGVGETEALNFVLIVHSVQTLLVIMLGIFAWTMLSFTRRKGTTATEKEQVLTT